MIKTQVNEVNPTTGEETSLGWVYFPEVPIQLPAFMPGVPMDKQAQSTPVIYHIGGRACYILGYRWDTVAAGTKDEPGEVVLFLAVRTMQAAQKPTLVRAGPGALDTLPLIGPKN